MSSIESQRVVVLSRYDLTNEFVGENLKWTTYDDGLTIYDGDTKLGQFSDWLSVRFLDENE